MKRVTHRDVARHAGVSTAVVSYVLNNGPRGISPKTRERVLKAIQELGYHPNAIARGLRIQRMHTIAFVANSFLPLNVFEAPYSAAILTGLTAELKSHGNYLLVYPMEVGENLEGLKALLWSGRVDGVVARLVQDPPATDRVLEVIAANRVPCVVVERPGATRFGFGSVIYDDGAGAYVATRYLIEQGHRRIAHLNGDPRYSTARARQEGYRRAMLEGFGALDENLIDGYSWNPSEIVTGTRQLLAAADPPTAIFAASDSLALWAIEVLRHEGYRVPEDVAVIGFDDIPLTRDLIPPLTTVRIPLQEIGRRAAEMVLRLVAGDAEGVESVVLPVELIKRGTA